MIGSTREVQGEQFKCVVFRVQYSISDIEDKPLNLPEALVLRDVASFIEDHEAIAVQSITIDSWWRKADDELMSQGKILTALLTQEHFCEATLIYSEELDAAHTAG